MNKGAKQLWVLFMYIELVLYQSKILLDDATLAWSYWESVDVPVGDTEVVNDSICRERDGHERLPTLVASIRLSSTLLRWKWHNAASTSVMLSDVSMAIL